MINKYNLYHILIYIRRSRTYKGLYYIISAIIIGRSSRRRGRLPGVNIIISRSSGRGERFPGINIINGVRSGGGDCIIIIINITFIYINGVNGCKTRDILIIIN